MTSASPHGPDQRFGAPYAAQHRLMAGALMGGLFVIGAALAFVLPTDEAPPSWVTLCLLAAGVMVHLALDAFGYRTIALDPSLDDDSATATAMAAYQAGMTVRAAFAEAIAITAVLLAFVLPEGGFSIYAVGGGVSISLMSVHVWPWARPVGKAVDRLESRGKSSRLCEVFGLPDPGPTRQP